MRPAFLLLLAGFSAAFAQDERRVTSPGGQLEFRIFVADQQDSALSRIAYQVWSKGKCVIDTSFMGLDIWDQEPILGENEGLIGSAASKHRDFNLLLAHYMQNGSTGRSIDIEIRAYDDAIAFRYIVPRSNMLELLRIGDETTEFVLKAPVAISEAPVKGFPAMHLASEEGNVQRVRLQRNSGNPVVAWEGKTPLTCPWRIILPDRSRERDVKTRLDAPLESTAPSH